MAEEFFISSSAAVVIRVLLAVTFGLLSSTSGIKAMEVSANSGRRILKGWEKEQQADQVVLPEQPAVKFAQFAGMITVDPKAGRDYFYFFVESPKDSLEKPLTLWLNGGPGCSSLAYGFAEEFGPYRILPDSSGVYLDNDHAWNRESNMLFLESPSGVGFSYSKNSSENEEGGDKRTAADNYLFLLNWFERFPQYKGRELYIAGESYAGHYVPQLAKLIVDSNPGAILKINLKGIMAGNPVTDQYWDNVGQIDYWHSHAMISDQTWKGMKAVCNFSDPDCCSKACNELFDQAWNDEIAGIDPYSIYTKACVDSSGTRRARRKASFAVRPNNPLMRARKGYDPCTADYSEVYFNRPEVQKALHVNVSGIIPYEWTGCSNVMQTWTDWDFSVIPVYKALIKAGLKIWVFSGDADAIVPVTSTRYAIAAMNLTVKESWRAWYHHQQVGGRVLKYEGLTFVTIRGAGHEVPLLQPGRALHMFKAFLAAKTLPVEPYE